MPQSEVTLQEIRAYLRDLELLGRFRDYRVDPVNPLVPLSFKRVLTEGYAYRFAEPYLDPGAFARNPLPDFMATAISRLLAAVLVYAFSIRTDSKMPQLVCYDLLPVRYEKLKALGVEIFKFDYCEEFDSELLAVRTSHGLVWAPIEAVQHWLEESHAILEEALSTPPD